MKTIVEFPLSVARKVIRSIEGRGVTEVSLTMLLVNTYDWFLISHFFRYQPDPADSFHRYARLDCPDTPQWFDGR